MRENLVGRGRWFRGLVVWWLVGGFISVAAWAEELVSGAACAPKYSVFREPRSVPPPLVRDLTFDVARLRQALLDRLTFVRGSKVRTLEGHLIESALESKELTPEALERFKTKYADFVMKNLHYVSVAQFHAGIDTLVDKMSAEGGPLRGEGKIAVVLWEPKGRGQRWITATILDAAIRKNPELKGRLEFIDADAYGYNEKGGNKEASYQRMRAVLKAKGITRGIGFDDVAYSGNQAAGTVDIATKIFDQPGARFDMGLVGATVGGGDLVREAGTPLGKRFGFWNALTIAAPNYDAPGFTPVERTLLRNVLNNAPTMTFLPYKLPDPDSFPGAVDAALRRVFQETGVRFPLEPYANRHDFDFPGTH